MSEQDDENARLRAAAEADGKAATADLAQRDQEGWDLNVRAGAANAGQAEANARLIDAQARVAVAQAKVRVAVARLLDWLIAVGVIVLALWIARVLP